MRLFGEKVCGTYNLAAGLLHLFFLLLWREHLRRLPMDIGELIDIFNIQIAILFFLVAYLYWAHSGSMRTTPFGRAVTWGMTIFWVARALEEVLFNRAWGAEEAAWFSALLLGAVLHASLLRSRARTTLAEAPAAPPGG